MRIVLDTNVLIAAALKGGFSEQILQLAKKKEIVTLICAKEILEELKSKLISKFRWLEYDAESFANQIEKISELVEIKGTLSVISRDPKDNKILECALSGNTDIIVTSDQDLIKLKEFRGIAIIHPKTFAWTFPKYFKENKKQ